MCADDGLLLERDRELEQIRRHLQRALESQGSVLIVEGPAGIGKTAMLTAARDAEASGIGHPPVPRAQRSLACSAPMTQLLASRVRKGDPMTRMLADKDLVDNTTELVRPINFVVDQGPSDDRARHMVRIAQLLYTFWNTGEERFLAQAVDTSFVDRTLPPSNCR